MRELDRQINALAARQHNLINRTQALDLGATEKLLRVREEQGWYRRRHEGVYIVGGSLLDWEGQVHAAVLLAQGQGLAYGRTALALRGLDAFPRGIIEVLVRHGEELSGGGVTLRRTRRMPEGVLINGIPTTPIERSLVDAARFVPPIVIEKGMECAVRRNLTSAKAIELFLAGDGKGLRGAKKLARVMAQRPFGGPAGSPAEVEVLDAIRRRGLPIPYRQLRIDLGRGEYASADFGWETWRKAVLYDGWDVHSGRQARETDLEKRHRLRDLGWEVLELTSGMIRDPERAADKVQRLLGGIAAA